MSKVVFVVALVLLSAPVRADMGRVSDEVRVGWVEVAGPRLLEISVDHMLVRYGGS